MDSPYPTAPVMLATSPSPSLQLTIHQQDNYQSLINSKQETVYYLSPKPQETILYDASMKPLGQTHHQNLTVIFQDHTVQLTPLFEFTFENQTYHWQAQHFSCYHSESKALLAQLKDQSILFYNNNPFRPHQFTESLIALIILSSQTLLNACRHNEKEEHDVASLSSVYHYPGHHSLVNPSTIRWSTPQSFKSIELDPGIWRCWWGYGFWWSWFPCCMPGGCCDRACIHIRGGHQTTLSRQGWQQQNY
ncbi:hypothetical protein A0J61_10285 [Choanephora cucurbitarum]|uniref:Uncharacterized protein n=1 Tax=Choanephora cucurbitarum TaxID=101091 RepID=A0A1C7MZ31_9FUNG|nr:hypothetical protein A0J61_10285 [Choanephora cucurbitarum]